MSGFKPLHLLYEPLIQFLILGALIFAVDHYVLLNKDDPRNIVVDDKKLRELVDIFTEGQGRPPSATEIDRLIITWTQNEILFREARQMGLDRGDDMIRSRLILKIRNILFNNIVVEAPPGDELEQWFEQYRAAYDTPALYDFEQFYLPDAGDKNAAAAMAAALADAAAPPAHSDRVRRYRQRPATNLTALFGERGGRDLLAAPLNTWVAASTDRGWHLARVTQRYAAQPAQFARVRNQVIRDWKNYTRDLQLSQQTQAIAERYDIHLEVSPEIVDELSDAQAALARPGPQQSAAAAPVRR